MPNLNNLTTQDKQWGAELWSSKGYIDGLTMQWVSGTALTVTTGTAYIESEQRLIPVTSAIAKTGLSLSASTWYHVYLYLNAGTPDIEIVTTAPASPYSGTARSKTGDTSRRYVGSVLTLTASADLMPFAHAGNRITWQIPPGVGTNGAPLRVLSGGTATTPTAFSTRNGVPVTSFSTYCRITNTATAGTLRFDNVLTERVTGSFGVFSADLGQSVFLDMPTDATQQLTYKYVTAPSGGGAYCDIHGYLLDR